MMIEFHQQNINILPQKANPYSNKHYFLLTKKIEINMLKTMKIHVICNEKKDYHYLCGQ